MRGNNQFRYDNNSTRPPPYNPYYHKNTADNGGFQHRVPNNNNRKSNKRSKEKQQIYAIILVSILLSSWYLTPISDIVASFLLITVPINSDVSLGESAWYSTMQHEYPTTYDRWNVQDIGRELVLSTTSRRSTTASTDLLNSFCSHHLNAADCQREIRNSYKWDFSVVRSNQVNAFALPGGIVRVTDSLLNKLELTRGEIAALIGHEMGHVLHRHSQVRLLKQKLLGTVLKAMVYEDDDDYEEHFGEALGEILLKSAKWLGDMRFSRRDEYQADEAAWDILQASQIYDPRCVQGLLEKLWSLEGSSSSNHHGNAWNNGNDGRTSWEMTHPGTADRIDALQKKWDGLSRREKRQLEKYPVK